MTTLDDLLGMRTRELRELIAHGHPVDPDALADRAMNGVSLAVPGIAKPFVWTKFRKTFRREVDGSLRGWNVACEQTPLDEPWIHKTRRGEPKTYWHYRVVEPEGIPLPGPYGNGLILDYTVGGNARLDYMNLVRDPLVAVNRDDPELLVGFSWLVLGPLQLILPAYFALAGGEPLDHDASPPRG